MSKQNRPPLEGLYIYGLLTLLAFVLSDLAILKTQLYLEGVAGPKSSAPNFRQPVFGGGGLAVRGQVSSEKYQRIVDRNLFNSDGIIPPPWGGGGEVILEDSDSPVKSDLPIQVIGTVVHANPFRSITSLALQGEESPAALKVGGAVRDLAEILAIFRRRVILRNLKNQRLEYIEIPDDPLVIVRKAPRVQIPKFQSGDEPAIVRSGNNFTVSRADVKNQLNNYQSLLRTARAVPHPDPITGELRGFKITQLQPGSLFQKLGIQPGDVIKDVNGESLTSMNRALEVFANLKGSVDSLNSVNINVERGGSDQALNYSVSD